MIAFRIRFLAIVGVLLSGLVTTGACLATEYFVSPDGSATDKSAGLDSCDQVTRGLLRLDPRIDTDTKSAMLAFRLNPVQRFIVCRIASTSGDCTHACQMKAMS